MLISFDGIECRTDDIAHLQVPLTCVLPATAPHRLSIVHAQSKPDALQDCAMNEMPAAASGEPSALAHEDSVAPLKIHDGDSLGELDVNVWDKLGRPCSKTTFDTDMVVTIKTRGEESVLSGTGSTKQQPVNDEGVATFKDSALKLELAKSSKVRACHCTHAGSSPDAP